MIRLLTTNFELTPFVTPGGTVSLDYDITDVPSSDPAQGSGNYVVTMQLASYGPPNFTNDASISGVLNPNNWKQYSKFNPTCQNPRVILQNTGSAPLTSCWIHVWIGGFDNTASFYWEGNLEFLEEEVVEIPVTPEWWYDWEGSNQFTAMSFQPNGVTDEYEQNNFWHTTFQAPPALNEPFYLRLQTNNKANENQVWMLNDAGDTVYSRYTLNNSYTYQDTFDLPTGCYTLEIYDSDHDGMGYWFSNIPPSSGGEGETNGNIRLRWVDGGTIVTIDRDFGYYTSYTFSVGYGVGLGEEVSKFDFEVVPNPSDGRYELTLSNFKGDKIDLQVYNDLGRLVYSETYNDNNAEGMWEKSLDLSHLADGLYIMKVVSDDLTATKRVIKK